MIDLSTNYLGLKLKNPIVVSASPLQKELELVRQMESAGAAAVVMHSLFEEQINVESEELNRWLEHGSESFATPTSGCSRALRSILRYQLMPPRKPFFS